MIDVRDDREIADAVERSGRWGGHGRFCRCGKGFAARDSIAQAPSQTARKRRAYRARKPGTLSIADGDAPGGWGQFNLTPPSKLLKVPVARSGCFNLVDRATGLNAAHLERNTGGSVGQVLNTQPAPSR